VYDQEAAVKWVSWDDQWVSYDDGESTQVKTQRASAMCLGGSMIWAIDLDDSDYTSANNLLGIGASNGIPTNARNSLRSGIKSLEEAEEIAESCYWTFCGGECTSGFTAETQARGQVPGLGYDAECPAGLAKTLCCAPSTTMGQCQWSGWRGVGMPCTGACSNSNAKSIASNTNNYRNVPDEQLIDQTCNGGTQQYCCEGFKPGSSSNMKDLILLGRDRRRSDGHSKRSLTKRKVPVKAMQEAQCREMEGTRAVLAVLSGINGVDLLEAGGLSAEIDVQIDACEKQVASTTTETQPDSGSGEVPPVVSSSPSGSETSSGGSTEAGSPPVDLVDDPRPEGFDGITSGQTRGGTRSGTNWRAQPAANPQGISKPAATIPKAKSQPKIGPKTYGRYAVATYDDDKPSDCATIYTCEYGLGFDEVIC
jgi:hypothetical protein